ncbi:family 43 glycosylhydrolase [Sediminibacillus dalangtanensis]|uniref:Endo-alpha-(1->5)-L-arabinanase n=1 Tax=Sediminibacillus dalangtanensis TaxID=2729421 RepID=A0ABX7VUB8_9BACI|nr:family 43 glycosylhydrolase [Sediminibacillus dalangtanensis]QTN00553.1 family 43 glycosylhydrolase [Sediminibacillus dalangtanensis]
MKKVLLLGMICTALFGCSSESGQSEMQETYQNPVYEPVLADPSILKAEDGFYYAYGTEDAWGDDAETKLVPIVRSKDLSEWEYIGEAFKDKPEWKGSGSIWAPDIHHYRDSYYLYYSLSVWGDNNPGIGVAVSDTPEGPFEDKGKLFTSEEIGVDNSIDPFFYSEDNQAYLVWGSFHGIYGVKLAEDGLSVQGEPFEIAGTDYEAPYIVKRDSQYYFFGSKGSCCEGENSSYHVAVGRSDSFTGPYVDQEGKPLMENGGTTILAADSESKFAGPGHNAILTDEAGKDWMVYHAIEKEDPLLWSGASRRPLMIDPISWEDGWPVVRDGRPSEEPQEAPVTE